MNVYLDRLTIAHAYFGGIGDGVARIVITRDAWKAMGEPPAMRVTLTATEATEEEALS